MTATLDSRRSRTRRWHPALVALVVFGLYLVPVLIQFWHILPHLATSEPEYGAGDLAKYNWSVAWVVYALSHGQGLFVSHVANVPFGVNLLDDTSILGLGVVMSPVTACSGRSPRSTCS